MMTETCEKVFQLENQNPRRKSGRVTSNSLEKLNTENNTFYPSTFVWGKLPGYQWWPGLIVDHTSCGMEPCSDKFWIYWFGEHSVSQLSKKFLLPFTDNFKKKCEAIKSIKLKCAIVEACKEFAGKYNLEVKKWKDDDYISWGRNNFPPQNISRIAVKLCNLRYSPNIMKKLMEICIIQSEKLNTRQKMQKSIGKSRRSLKGSFRRNAKSGCLGCGISGLCSDMTDHPLFEGELCQLCLERFKKTFYVYEEEIKYIYCCICGHPSNINSVCTNSACERMYCEECMDAYVLNMKGRNEQHWLCFLCQPLHKDSSIKRRSTWPMEIFKLFSLPEEMKMKFPPDTFPRKSMCVLSLFDSTNFGYDCLYNLNITIEKYYSAKNNGIIKKCSSFSQNNMVDLGNMDDLFEGKFMDVNHIDLLISYISCLPSCTSTTSETCLSEDKSTYEKLFFKFFCVKQHLLKKLSGHHLFWLFATEINLSESSKTTISRFLERPPSSNYSSSDQCLIYWTNIPTSKPVSSLNLIFKPLCCFFK